MTSNHKTAMSLKLTGPIAAPFTPLRTDGEINYDVLEEYVNKLVADGVRSVFVCGTTGEGLSMTLGERKTLAEKWITLGKNKFQAVIVHIGALCMKDIQELARHAEEHGADAISTIPPLFFKPSSMDDMVDFLQQAASAAPNTPFFYYHNPEMIGTCKFSLESLFEKLYKPVKRIPTLCGVKYTSFNLFDYGRCQANADTHCPLMYGVDELLLPALTLGGDAFIGSTYNYLGRVANRVQKAFNAGDMATARKDQYNIQALVSVLVKYGSHLGINKAIMSIVGPEMGPARTPLYNPTPAERIEIRKDLEAIGFFEWNK